MQSILKNLKIIATGFINDPRFRGKKIITSLSRLDEKYKGSNN